MLRFTVPAFVIGGALLLLGSRGQASGVVRERWLKFAVFVGIVHGVVGVAAFGAPCIGALTAVIVAVGAFELARALRHVSGHRVSIWTVYVMVGGLAVAGACLNAEGVTVFIFLTAASFDGFSQVVGQWLGRVPLAPSISARKTVEGLAGGLAGAALSAAVLGPLIGGAALAVAWSVLIGFTALGGDLAKSWVKRQAGMKDFARTLPGHGGVLDRFDSYLAANALAGSLFLVIGS